jgi:hypothetical protein
MDCRRCSGTGMGARPGGICPVCDGRGTLPDDPTRTEECRRCSGTGMGAGPFRTCLVCKGYGKIRPAASNPDPEGPLIFSVEAGKPRTAHLALTELFNTVSGEIRICDPYYGTGSLVRLDLLTHCSPIRFLTKKANSAEASHLPRYLQEWKQQHGAVEFRKAAGQELHDRYLLSDAELIILGHGLKDVGNKDSFVIRIPHSLAPDMLVSVRTSFDQRWQSATLIA